MTAPAAASRWLDRTHGGDCRRLLRRMRADGVRVQACVTSPPYFRLRSYLPPGHRHRPLEIGQQDTPQAYIASLVESFHAVRDLLTDDGTLWIVIGDTYAANRSYQVASTIGGIKHAAAQGASGSIRISGPIKQKDMLGIPWTLALALRDDGWYLRQEVIWHKLNPQPESVADRCTRAHEQVFLLSKRARYHFNQKAIREPAAHPRGPGNVRPVRHPPGQRASGANANLRGGLHKIGPRTTRNKRDVWSIAGPRFRGAHFAVFPDQLVIPCVLASSRTGDTILDPFMGSGTTAAVALQLRRRFIGCELNPEFIRLQRLHQRASAGHHPHTEALA